MMEHERIYMSAISSIETKHLYSVKGIASLITAIKASRWRVYGPETDW